MYLAERIDLDQDPKSKEPLVKANKYQGKGYQAYFTLCMKLASWIVGDGATLKLCKCIKKLLQLP